jgi:Domain of unknown function (DUF4219)
MSTEDNHEKPFSTQIERLSEKNYRSWSTQVRAVLRHQKVLDVVEREAKPTEPTAPATQETTTQYNASLDA